ncbi:MAG: acetyl-CoA carboxylase carboxyl transferase subunit alpha, partial [Sulfurovaceae bacterium]|nr:acetyl-CoA carboxylase carboxyl transferase subunit alpha [Sulfurovaceae bacterium]
NDPKKVEQASNALKITPDSLLENGLIDDILDEPLIGAHRDKKRTAQIVKEYFLENVKKLKKLSTEEMLNQRYNRLTSIGAYTEAEQE